MSGSKGPQGDRSVHVGGNLVGSIVQTGDEGVASLRYEQISLPEPESVDIRAELASIKEALLKLASSDSLKIQNAVDEAEAELTKPQPDKNEVGKALERALDYAKKAEGFASAVEKLKTPIANAAAWLGDNWHKILGVVGLCV
jgi:hypothetical protein